MAELIFQSVLENLGSYKSKFFIVCAAKVFMEIKDRKVNN